MITKPLLLIVWVVLAVGMGGLAAAAQQGQVLHVAGSGDDANPGTSSKPVRTLPAARDLARRMKNDAPGPVTVRIAAGTYYLAEPVVFTAADSGTAKAPIVYEAAPDQAVTISGGIRLDLKWTPYKGGIVRADVPAGMAGKLSFDQLFVNGVRQRLARYPNYNPKAQYFGGFSRDAFSARRAAGWADPAGGLIHAMHRNHWGDFHYRITGKDAKGQVKYVGGWQNNRRMGMHASHRFVENVFEELDAPGEWYLDRAKGVLYFLPPAGTDLARATVELAGIDHLFEFRGTRDEPVRFVTLRGLRLTHTARTFMRTKEPLLRSDWCIYRGGAVLFEGAEDCALADCHLDAVGGNAVFVSNYNRRVEITGCEIAHAGASGVCFVGDPNAVRSGSFEYHESVPREKMDLAAGPKGENYPAHCRVHDNLMHGLGRVEKQIAGVQISMSAEITVSHNTIYDLPRAGINISEGTWGGHVIEFNDVFETVKETGDHGSFNSWGRDRWWHPNRKTMERLAAEHPEMIRLDAAKTTILRNNRWRCDHGWDIDLDDGSSNYHIYNNLCLRGGIKLREGFFRTVENNIMVGNSFHPHVWFAGSGDVFRRNIVMTPYRPIRVPKPWGKECDNNLLHAPGRSGPARELQTSSGRDANSIVGDAKFVAPAKGDFRVADDSPARTLGFESFPMDSFGVVSPRLRARARTPEITFGQASRKPARRSSRDGRVVEWLGAKVKNLIGQGEMSAAGVGGEIGVLVLAAPSRSAAARQGLRKNDLILGVGGKDVRDLATLLARYRAAEPGSDVRLKVLREQKDITVQIARGHDVSLSPRDAKIAGPKPHPTYDRRKDYLGSWRNDKASLQWTVTFARAGAYDVAITLATPASSAGARYAVTVGEKSLTGTVEATGDWETFVTKSLGTIEIDKPGKLAVSLTPRTKPGVAVMNFRAITLTPRSGHAK